jgi:hypothetical protein
MVNAKMAASTLLESMKLDLEAKLEKADIPEHQGFNPIKCADCGDIIYTRKGWKLHPRACIGNKKGAVIVQAPKPFPRMIINDGKQTKLTFTLEMAKAPVTIKESPPITWKSPISNIIYTQEEIAKFSQQPILEGDDELAIRKRRRDLNLYLSILRLKQKQQEIFSPQFCSVCSKRINQKQQIASKEALPNGKLYCSEHLHEKLVPLLYIS